MADNTRLPIGTADGDTYASDDISSIKYQRVKITIGADGVNAGDVASANPMPVTDSSVGSSSTAIAVSTAAAATSLAAIDDLSLAQSVTTVGQKGILTMGAVTTGAPTYTTAQISPISLDTTGAVRVVGGAASTQYLQGTASNSTDSTTMSGAIRRDTAAVDAGVADLDHVILSTNSVGGLWTALSTAIPAGNNNIGDVDAACAGDVAHDAVDSGNPIKLGMKAIAVGASPTAVSAADRTNWYANVHGVPFVQPGHPNVVTIATNFTAAQTNAALVTVGAGNKIVVTRCSVALDNANTVDVAVTVGFATATTPTTTGVLFSHPGMFAGQHICEGNGGGMLGIGADNEDIRYTTEVPTGGSGTVTLTYYILPV